MSTPSARPPQAQPYLAATARFAVGEDTPRAFLDRCLATYAQREPEIGAFVHVDLDGARSAADRSTERWRAGQPLSPIDGMPVGVKDIMESRDLPTEMGSPLFAGWRSLDDAAAVHALREAGAVIVGKTVTTEFAATEPGGTRNPHDPSRTPGGSSSGSAAGVAAGMISSALGTQVIGSIVRPASYCGCYGFKPSVGAINRGGSHDPLSQSVTGVLGATLADTCQTAYEVAVRAGGDPGFPGLFGPDRLPERAAPARIALIETSGWANASAQARQGLEDALARMEQAGVRIVRRAAHAGLEAVEAALVDARPLSTRINAWETRWPLNVFRERDAGGLSRAMHDRLALAESMRLEDYRAALDARAHIRALYAKLAEDCDACVTLSAPGAAPVGLNSTGDPVFAVPFSLLGVPALSLPLLQDDGLPVGLQVAGFAHRDGSLFSTAGWIEALVRGRN
jgi:Asp-tRNA(Asn)/Glu-tRNA(Gln) amidotransferase A subunit family amidase